MRAKRLYREMDAWRKVPLSSQAPPQPCTAPQVEGTTAPALSYGAALRYVGIYVAVGFLAGSLRITFEASTGVPNISTMVCLPAVCGALAFFIVWPRLRRSRLGSLTASPARVAADS